MSKWIKVSEQKPTTSIRCWFIYKTPDYVKKPYALIEGSYDAHNDINFSRFGPWDTEQSNFHDNEVIYWQEIIDPEMPEEILKANAAIV